METVSRAERRRVLFNRDKKPVVAPKNNGEARTRPATEFLKKYRALGLPGSKKFRKRTRAQRLTYEKVLTQRYLEESFKVLKVWEPIVRAVANEENWVLHAKPNDDQDMSVLVWNGDENLINDAQKALKLLQPREAGVYPGVNDKNSGVDVGGKDETMVFVSHPSDVAELQEVSNADEKELSGETVEEAGGSRSEERAIEAGIATRLPGGLVEAFHESELIRR